MTSCMLHIPPLKLGIGIRIVYAAGSPELSSNYTNWKKSGLIFCAGTCMVGVGRRQWSPLLLLPLFFLSPNATGSIMYGRCGSSSMIVIIGHCFACISGHTWRLIQLICLHWVVTCSLSFVIFFLYFTHSWSNASRRLQVLARPFFVHFIIGHAAPD